MGDMKVQDIYINHRLEQKIIAQTEALKNVPEVRIISQSATYQPGCSCTLLSEGNSLCYHQINKHKLFTSAALSHVMSSNRRQTTAGVQCFDAGWGIESNVYEPYRWIIGRTGSVLFPAE